MQENHCRKKRPISFHSDDINSDFTCIILNILRSSNMIIIVLIKQLLGILHYSRWQVD